MRKKYPYLQDSFYEDANSAATRRNFLSKLDETINQKQYVKITLLNWKEQPIKEIQGALTGGTLTKDGSSSVRRTCQLSTIVDAGSYNLEDASMDFAINKKIFIELGMDNVTGEWGEYPVLWFPQGVFFISSFQIGSSAGSAVSISLSLKDKMCGLNGDVGGTFPATIIFDQVDTQNAAGAYVTEKVLIYNIIQELVHHYGGEDLNNIVIEDVPLRIKQVMKWTGSNPLYLTQRDGATYKWYEASLTKPNNMKNVRTIPSGDDAGYIYRDFTYTGDLTANLGENVCTILDKLKQYLGNYEYFYDEFGIFHFREIKNYLNTTQVKILLDDMDKHSYMVDTTTGKSVYTFSDKINLTNISANPKYENIKNDYVIQGTRQGTSSSAAAQVRYHLAIDRKPELHTYYDLLLYTEKSTNLVKPIFPKHVSNEASLPIPGNFNLIYCVDDSNRFVYWDNKLYKDINGVAYYPTKSSTVNTVMTVATESASESTNTNSKTDTKTDEQKKDADEITPPTIVPGGYKVKDWRTEIYLQGLLAKNNGTDAGLYYQDLQNYAIYSQDSGSWQKEIYVSSNRERIDTDFYYEELEAFWPQVYDMAKQQFIGIDSEQSLWASSLTDGNYYLDFIDPQTSGLGQFAVNNIGRRTDAVSSQDVNCLFTPDIPDIIFLNLDSDDIESERAECMSNAQPFTQVRGELFYAFSIGGYKNAAFDQLKYELYLHTNYQQTLSLTARPAFYLEPNVRTTINDATTNTYGDYVIQNISIPLGAGNNMSVSASQCIERF